MPPPPALDAQSLAQGAKEAPAVARTAAGAAASGSSTAPGTPKLGTVPSRGPTAGPIPSANGLTSPLSAVPARIFSSVSTTNTMRSSKSLVDLIAGVHAEPLRGTMPAQQGSRVKHMAFDANCTTAAVLLYDSTVSLWDVASGKCRAQLIRRGERDASRTHSGGVNAVYLTRDGSTAVTISKDYTSRVWDVATGVYWDGGVTLGLRGVVVDCKRNSATGAAAPPGWDVHGLSDEVVRLLPVGRKPVQWQFQRTVVWPLSTTPCLVVSSLPVSQAPRMLLLASYR